MRNEVIYSEKYSLSANKYLYNGKELQDEAVGGTYLDWYDYGARFYDPQIGRFHSQYRFAEKYLDFTPYQYGANNPILFIDVNGDSIKYANSAIESYIKQFTSKTITTKQGKVKENKNYHEGFAELIGNLESADEMFVFTNDKSLQTDQSAEGEFTFGGKNFNIIFNEPAEGYGGKSGLLFEETFHAGQFLEGKAWFTKSKNGAWSGNGVDVYDEYYAKSFAATAPGVRLSYERSGLNIQTQLGIVSSLTPHMARRYLIEGTTGFSQGNKIGYPAAYPNLSTANTNSPYKEKRVNGNIYAYPAKN